jgi:hypothetical protein
MDLQTKKIRRKRIRLPSKEDRKKLLICLELACDAVKTKRDIEYFNMEEINAAYRDKYETPMKLKDGENTRNFILRELCLLVKANRKQLIAKIGKGIVKKDDKKGRGRPSTKKQ